MAGKYIKAAQSAISAATATGYITVSSVANFYERAFVWLNNSGQPNVLAQITEILTGTNQLGVRLVNHPGEAIGGEPTNYGRSNLSAYNGGTVYQDEQLIYNRGENIVA